MIEKTCKIELKSIDFLVLECGGCGSEIRAVKSGDMPINCPVCNKRYSDYGVDALRAIMQKLQELDDIKMDEKLYILTKEDVK